MTEGSSTILVVDDEPMVLGVVKTALELAGYAVITAKDGAEALRTFQADNVRIDLALLDYFTPGMNGPDLFRRLRELDPGISVIMMSGYTEQLLEAFRNDPGFGGMTDVLPKPFLPSQLVAKVRGALARTSESA